MNRILNSERCRLLPGHTCQLMQLAVEGLQVPDVRDAEEEDEAAFNNFLDKAYRLWLAKPHRGLQWQTLWSSSHCLSSVMWLTDTIID